MPIDFIIMMVFRFLDEQRNTSVQIIQYDYQREKPSYQQFSQLELFIFR